MSDITTNPIAEAIKFRQLGATPKQEQSQQPQEQPAPKPKEQKEVRRRVTAYLPIPLAKWLNTQKFDTGREISEIVEEALEEYIERH